MVAHITEGSTRDRDGQPFRRRNYRPAIVAVAVLAVGAFLLLPQAASHIAPAAEPAAVIRNLRRDRLDMGAKRLGEWAIRTTGAKCLRRRASRNPEDTHNNGSRPEAITRLAPMLTNGTKRSRAMDVLWCPLLRNVGLRCVLVP